MNKRSTKSKQKRILSKRAKRIRKLFTGFMMAFLICVSGSAFLVSAHGISGGNDIRTGYRSIEIRKGDTLWEIAERTKPADSVSTPEYVQVLKEMNHLSSDTIMTGQHLIIMSDSI